MPGLAVMKPCPPQGRKILFLKQKNLPKTILGDFINVPQLNSALQLQPRAATAADLVFPLQPKLLLPLGKSAHTKRGNKYSLFSPT